MQPQNRYITGQITVIKDDWKPLTFNRFTKNQEIKEVDNAIKSAKKELRKSIQNSSKDMKSILQTHLHMLEDKFIIQEIKNYINKKNKPSFIAILNVFKKYEEMMVPKNGKPNNTRNYMDIIDVRNRLIKHLNPDLDKVYCEFRNRIIFKKSILPSDLAEYEKLGVLAVVTENECEIGHIAIAIKASKIPVIMGIKNATKWKSKLLVTIDTFTKKIFFGDQRKKINNENSKSITKDKKEISVYQNINLASEIKNGINPLFSGVGLYRSEFLYLDKKRMPSSNELFNEYKFLLSKSKNKEVFFRLLDIGWDKTPPYVNFLKSNNSPLGMRGIRVLKLNRKIFISQIMAILKTSKYGKLSIMIPMVSSIDEIKEVKKIINSTCKKLGINKRIKIGAMIETPASVINIDKIIDQVDFVSIGSNDLTQYTFACDRNIPQLKNICQSNDPTMLKMIKIVLDSCKKKKKDVCICGEMSNNLYSLILLIGLGIKKISISQQHLEKIKWLISNVSFNECQQLVNKAINLSSYSNVESLCKNYLKNKKLI